MNHSSKATWAALLIALASTVADAQMAMPKTREQVRQELAEAIREGTMTYGESGMQMREAFPESYPKSMVPAMPGRTRAQVSAELEAAQRSGAMPVGESGFLARELYPERYPKSATPAYAGAPASAAMR